MEKKIKIGLIGLLAIVVILLGSYFLNKPELKEVKGLCTVDFRKTKLQTLSAKFGIPLFSFSRDEINSVDVKSKSAASDVFGIRGVAEPCAILGANRNKSMVKFIKRKSFDKKITLVVVF